MQRWVHMIAYLWTTLAFAMLVGCAWNGAPKVPIDPAYAECKRTCKGVCAADGQCLPTEYPK